MSATATGSRDRSAIGRPTGARCQSGPEFAIIVVMADERKGGPMSIALTAEHEQLRDVACRWLAAHCPREVVRAGLDDDDDPANPGGASFTELGWQGLA